MTILPPQVPPSFVSLPARMVGVLLGTLGMLWLGCAAGRPAAPAAVAAPVPPVAEPAVKAKEPILQVGIPVERSLPPGGEDEISLDLEAGFYLRLALDGRGTELNASLVGPGGEVVAKDESDLEGRLAWITAAKGTYRLAVSAPKAKVPCRYQVLLLQHRPAIHPDDDQRLVAEAALLLARREKVAAKAVQQAQEALKLWRQLGDSDGEFEALDVIKASDDENAISWYQKALEQAQATGSLSHQARARTDLSDALIRQGKLDEARSQLKAALPVWESLGDSYRRARTLYYLGIGSARAGDYAGASGFYKEALESSEPAWDITPDIWNALGDVYSNRGESHEALECFERALRLATNMDRTGAKAVLLASLGNLHWRRGEPRAALDQLMESLRLNQSDPELQSDAPKVQLLLGSVYLGLGEQRQALDNFQKAYTDFRQREDDYWISSALVSIGRAYLLMDQPMKGLESFREALKIATAARARIPKQEGVALQWIGVAQLQLRQVAEAVQSLKEALQIQEGVDRPGQALTEQKLGEAYQAQGDLAASRAALNKALQITESTESTYARLPILLDLARLDRRQGNLRVALRWIEEAIKILESVRYGISDDRLRTSFLASRRSYYEFYVEILMELDRKEPGQGYADQALAKSEMSRARALLDLLTQERFELTRGISAELREKERDVRARLAQIQSKLVEELSRASIRAAAVRELEARRRETEAEQQEVEQRIKTEYPLYAQLRYPSPLQRKEIQGLLQPDEALLEYSIGEEGAYLFVVTTEGLTVHPLKTASAKLGEDVETVRPALESGGRLTNAYLRTAHRLYEELVAPARAELQGKRRLLIAPDGALYHLAFEALLTRDAQREAGCHFLIEDWAISYIPSASVLSSLHSQAAEAGPRKRLIAFAPAYGPGSQERDTRSAGPSPARAASQDSLLPGLEGAREEVAAIAHLYPEQERSVYVGPEASRESFKKSSRTAFLHFAGHGVLDEEHPERSSLVFSDGALRVADIFNLELSSDLVVLSACRTAGKVVAGEGLVGLTRAFLYAGTPSVMVTLWQAVDSSARDLMVQFYANLGQSEDKAEALRQAKLAMIGRGRRTESRLIRPYYWAPFILVGKSR